MFGDQRSSNSDRVPYKTHPTEQLTINATENFDEGKHDGRLKYNGTI